MNASHQLHCRVVLSSQSGVNVLFVQSCSNTIQVKYKVKLLIIGVNDQLPWIMLMPGFNCYASDYSTIQHLLAGRGYLVAVADEFHPASSVTEGPVLSRECYCQCSAAL